MREMKTFTLSLCSAQIMEADSSSEEEGLTASQVRSSAIVGTVVHVHRDPSSSLV